MSEIQASVIVPVYKAEKYLRRCLDSIAAQTYKDFEVILIDDGSPDRSGEMSMRRKTRDFACSIRKIKESEKLEHAELKKQKADIFSGWILMIMLSPSFWIKY